LSGEEDALEARRRLFFVALTRAKRHLYLSYAETDDVGKNLTASRFLSESGVETVPAAVSTEQLFFAQTVLLTEPPRPVVTLPDEQVLADFLDGFTLNVTSFNRYLRCPLAFFYEDVLRVPGTPSEAAAFGQAMHTALQQFFLKMQRSTQHEWPDEDSLLRLFGQEMERLRGFFSQNAWTQRMALGRSLLIRYRLEQVPYWRKRARAEFRLDRVNLDDAVLTGVVDKIEYLDDGSLRIVDYKTGTPNPKKTAAPTLDEPQGGDYWRQLAFYRVLLEQSKLFAEDARRGVISWLELDKKGNFTNHETVFEPQDLAAVRDLIRSVWRSIQNREFSTGCGQPDCAWCRMHRDRTLPEVVSKPEEGLDDAPNF
jgi:DNA helicase-2/ATP-dependent DNA helicase PcrA